MTTTHFAVSGYMVASKVETKGSHQKTIKTHQRAREHNERERKKR